MPSLSDANDSPSESRRQRGASLGASWLQHALGQSTVTTMALRMTYMAPPSLAASMPVEREERRDICALKGDIFAFGGGFVR